MDKFFSAQERSKSAPIALQEAKGRPSRFLTPPCSLQDPLWIDFRSIFGPIVDRNWVHFYIQNRRAADRASRAAEQHSRGLEQQSSRAAEEQGSRAAEQSRAEQSSRAAEQSSYASKQQSSRAAGQQSSGAAEKQGSRASENQSRITPQR